MGDGVGGFIDLPGISLTFQHLIINWASNGRGGRNNYPPLRQAPLVGRYANRHSVNRQNEIAISLFCFDHFL